MKIINIETDKLYKVPKDQVYEWVKTGVWNKKMFIAYCESLEDYKESKGWKDGYFGE